MGFMTRWFGTRVERNELATLLKAVGEDPRAEFARTERFQPFDIHGRYRAIPQENGVRVEVYVVVKMSGSTEEKPHITLTDKYPREYARVVSYSAISENGPLSALIREKGRK